MSLHRSLRRRLIGWFALIGALVIVALFGGYYNLRSSVQESVEEDIGQRIDLVQRELVSSHTLYDSRVRIAMKVLKEATAAEGVPSVGDPVTIGARTVRDLRFGSTPTAFRFEMIDRVTSLMGGTVTLFTRDGDNFIRITTNVERANGTRAVGTMLDPNGPAIAAIRKGEAYYGVVDILGRSYITGYDPIHNAAGEIIGIYYVGYLVETLNQLDELLTNSRLLKHGFFALLDRQGYPLFHTRDADIALIKAAGVRSAKTSAWTDGKWQWRAKSFPLWDFTFLSATYRPDVEQESWLHALPVFGFMTPVILCALGVGFFFARQLSGALRKADQLQAESRKLALVASRTSNGVLITGADGRIEWVNDGFTRITGYAYDEIIGRHPDSFLMGADTSPATLAEKKRARQEKRGFQLEIVNYHKSGRKIWIYADGQPLMDEAGNVTNYFVIQTDITKRKEFENDLHLAREAAEEANRTKSAFLANMSHELRTPMNAIIGYSEMLVEEAEDLGQDAFVPDLKKIHSAGKHLLGLINDVLDLSKIESGKMTLYLEDFAVPVMVKEVTSTIQPLIEKNTNQLVVECSSGLGAMRADVTKVRQILFNLLSNAAKFTENGRITLTAFTEKRGDVDWVIFRVADTGIGMTPEQLGRLFQAFMQADASTTRKYGGTGLGLAISRKFTQLMGGDIVVTSEVGQGTAFSAEIPLRVIDPNAAPVVLPAPVHAAVTPTLGAPKPDAPLILIVDDDPTVIDLLSRDLIKEGYSVRSASNGREALAAVKKEPPQLITLDVMMPSMDGWSVLTALKADPETRNIPVVMISMVEDRQLGFALGAADYLTKPIDRSRLSDILSQHAPHNTQRVALIIDDLPDNRAMLAHALTREGWTTIEAENGREGLDRFAEQKPNLILLDIMMPVMDGFEFLRELRNREDGRAVPVVVVTAKELTTEERDLLRACVENVVQKGTVSHDNLLAEIRGKIASHR